MMLARWTDTVFTLTFNRAAISLFERPSQINWSTSSSRGVSRWRSPASAGLASLTPQQFRVLTMVCEGLLNKQIAYELNVSEATIKAHVTAIFRKLNVRTRTQAALLLQQLESISPQA